MLAAVVSVVNGAAIVLTVYSDTNQIQTLIWFGAVVVSALFLVKDWIRYRNSAVPDQVSGRYLRRSEFAALLMGTLWGCAAFLVHDKSSTGSFFVFVIQISMASGFAALTAPIPRISLRFAIPCILLSALWNLMSITQVGMTSAALTALFLTALVLGGMESRRQLVLLVRNTTAARSAKEDLVDAIESLNDAFSLRDSSGKLVLANARHMEWFPSGSDDSRCNEGEPCQVGDGRWVMRSVRPTRKGGLVSIHSDVTALKKRERELIASSRDAELADEAKTRFLSSMSQELRTPLNIILSFAKLMARDSNIPNTPEDVAEYSDQILDNGRHLLALIDDIIDYSKVGLDKYLLERKPVSLGDAVEKAIRLAAASVEGASAADIETIISRRVQLVMVDETAFQRILVNLISNAFKFRRTDPRIIIKASLDLEGRPIISVRDFGIGIPEGELDYVFDAFSQIDTPTSRKAGGAGLGLTLSRRLARLHGGDVMLKSRHGAGTTAVLVLPADAHVAPLATDAPQEAKSSAA